MQREGKETAMKISYVFALQRIQGSTNDHPSRIQRSLGHAIFIQSPTDLQPNAREWSAFMVSLSKAAITESFIIWCSWNSKQQFLLCSFGFLYNAKIRT